MSDNQCQEKLSSRIESIERAAASILSDPQADKKTKTAARLFIPRAANLRASLIVAESKAMVSISSQPATTTPQQQPATDPKGQTEQQPASPPTGKPNPGKSTASSNKS